jgi:hypothetical protein
VGLSNYAYPAARQGLVAAGVGLRNYAYPVARQGLLAAGRTVRNYVGAPLLNYTRRCIGAACRRGAAAIGIAANRTRNHGVFLASALGRFRFTPGLAITANDRAVVRGIMGSHEPNHIRTNVRVMSNRNVRAERTDAISTRISQFAENLGERIENYIVDNHQEPSVAVYTEIATNDLFSGDIKGLYLLKHAQSGTLESADPITRYTAAHIAMQVNNGIKSEVAYEDTSERYLQEKLDELEAQGEAHFHSEGGRGRNRKNSRKTRKQKKNRKH